jgi:hypothetical protein
MSFSLVNECSSLLVTIVTFRHFGGRSSLSPLGNDHSHLSVTMHFYEPYRLGDRVPGPELRTSFARAKLAIQDYGPAYNLDT